MVKMKWMAALILMMPGVVLAQAELPFHVCSEYLQQAELEEHPDGGWQVYIKLTEPGASSFEQFTKRNVGSMGRIVANGRVFSRARIMAPVSSGVLRGHFHSQDEASAWLQTLRGHLPSGPCGGN